MSEEGVVFTPLEVNDSVWDPKACKVTMNCRLQGCIIPTQDGHRADAAHLIVLDDFFGEAELSALLQDLAVDTTSENPSGAKWERNTADDAHASKTWGLKEDVLNTLQSNPTPAMLEIQTRIVRLYSDFDIAHMPSHSMQSAADVNEDEHQDDQHGSVNLSFSERDDAQGDKNTKMDNTADYLEAECEPGQQGIDCCNVLANAPVHGDHYAYHEDANPVTLPDSTYRQAFGDYFNREPGKPLLVSLLLYLVDKDWDSAWHGETLFLDTATDIGLMVRPKRFRAVLMDQDVWHRVVAPSVKARAPRYSLVWKLAFLPKFVHQECSISRPEWGPTTNLGSATNFEQAKQALQAQKQGVMFDSAAQVQQGTE